MANQQPSAKAGNPLNVDEARARSQLESMSTHGGSDHQLNYDEQMVEPSAYKWQRGEQKVKLVSRILVSYRLHLTLWYK